MIGGIPITAPIRPQSGAASAPSTTPELESTAMADETDGMVCRACGRDERASEGYPCDGCGTFVCLMCSFRGVTRCSACAEKAGAPNPPAGQSADE